jgi:hypothetical protein
MCVLLGSVLFYESQGPYHFPITLQLLLKQSTEMITSMPWDILGIKETYQVRLIFPQIPKPGSHIRHTNLKSIVQKSSL